MLGARAARARARSLRPDADPAAGPARPAPQALVVLTVTPDAVVTEDEALRHLEGVRVVDPYPDPATSTAVVHLENGRLPALDRWQEQFTSSANGSYRLRGVEVELSGAAARGAGGLVLDSGGPRPPVRLVPLTPAAVVQWNTTAGTPAAATPGELAAHDRLGAGTTATVTGPLSEEDGEYVLAVRSVAAERP